MAWRHDARPPACLLLHHWQWNGLVRTGLAGVCQRTSASGGAALGRRAQWHQLQHCPQLRAGDRRIIVASAGAVAAFATNAFLYLPLLVVLFLWRRVKEPSRLPPVHCKSMPAQEVRALLTARKLVQSKLFDIEMSLRGILRGFGPKVGRTTPNRFGLRVEELVAGHPTLEIIGKALLAAHEVLLREFNGFEKRVRQQARQDKRVRLVMSAPGVGPI